MKIYVPVSVTKKGNDFAKNCQCMDKRVISSNWRRLMDEASRIAWYRIVIAKRTYFKFSVSLVN